MCIVGIVLGDGGACAFPGLRPASWANGLFCANLGLVGVFR